MAKKRKKKGKGERVRSQGQEPDVLGLDLQRPPPEGQLEDTAPPERDPLASTPTPRRDPLGREAALAVSLGEQRAIPLGETPRPDPVHYRPVPELSVPPVELHPADPDHAPLISGEIGEAKRKAQGPQSLLAVSFGEQREPSIQIDSDYQEDARRLVSVALATHFDEETPPLRRIPLAAIGAPAPPRPEAPPSPSPASPGAPEAPGPAPQTEELLVADLEEVDEQLDGDLPVATVDVLAEGEPEPVFTMDPGPAPSGDSPGTKLSALLARSTDTSAPRGPQALAGAQGSPFPPALDAVRKTGRRASIAPATYTVPSAQTEIPVSLRPFRPAAFVITKTKEDDSRGHRTRGTRGSAWESAAGEAAGVISGVIGSPPTRPAAEAPVVGPRVSVAVDLEVEREGAARGEAPLRPEPELTKPRPSPVPRAPKQPIPETFNELEMAFFERDLNKVEKVDTFEDLVQDDPKRDGTLGRLFGRGKKPPDPARSGGPPSTLPRPPKKRP